MAGHKEQRMHADSVSVVNLEGCGFNTRPGHTKDYINRTLRLPAWRSVLAVGLCGG